MSAYECDEGLGGGGYFWCVSASHKCMHGHTGRCAQRTYVSASVSTLVCGVTHRDIQVYEPEPWLETNDKRIEMCAHVRCAPRTHWRTVQNQLIATFHL